MHFPSLHVYSFYFEELELRLYKRVPIYSPASLVKSKVETEELSLFPYV